MAFGDYQFEIYLQGLSGILPSYPMAFAELEAKAKAAMPPSVWSYVAGGAGDERPGQHPPPAPRGSIRSKRCGTNKQQLNTTCRVLSAERLSAAGRHKRHFKISP